MSRRSLILAVCAAAGLLALSATLVSARQSNLNYNEASKPIANGTQDGDEVECAHGKVTGGGVYVTGTSLDIEVATSAPLDSRDGWTGYANNDSGSQQTMTVSAICMNGVVKYARKNITLPDNGATKSKSAS